MTASFRNFASNTTTGSTALVVNKPTDTAQFDLLFAIIAFNGSTGSTPILSAGTGASWIRESQLGITQGSLTLHRYWKIANASEPASYSFSWTTSRAAAAIIGAWQSLDYFLETVLDGASSVYYVLDRTSVTASSGASMNSPALSYVEVSSRLALGIWAVASFSNVTYAGHPTGVTPRATAAATSGPTVHLADEAMDMRDSPFQAIATKGFTQNISSAYFLSRYALRDELITAEASFGDQVLPEEPSVSEASTADGAVTALPERHQVAEASLFEVPEAKEQLSVPLVENFDAVFPGEQTVLIIDEEGW